jgi:hypothetical protein
MWLESSCVTVSNLEKDKMFFPHGFSTQLFAIHQGGMLELLRISFGL